MDATACAAHAVIRDDSFVEHEHGAAVAVQVRGNAKIAYRRVDGTPVNKSRRTRV
jgi:hypothetical protein